ncbi:MAG: hypothetical protein LH477_08450 [Nocardioides sp.]|nr:hypothetical protein [Nocardioides sp.]
MTDLHRVLTEATDHLRSPDLADRAQAGAGRRRARRTTLGALAVVVLLGGGVTWTVQDRVPRVEVVDTPAPSPTAIETNEGRMGTQPLWDPFTVAGAQRGQSVLPQRLDPPPDPTSVFDSPISAVVVAWPEEGRALRLLSPDGEWRSVPGTESLGESTLYDVVSPAISRDGRLVAFSAEEGLWVVDVSSGERRVLPWPAEIAGPWDTLPGVRWMPGDEAVLVSHWNTPWIVGLDGSDEDASYLGQYTATVAVDPDGPLLQRRFRSGSLVEWRDGEVVNRLDDDIAWGERMVAGHGMVAITGGLGGGAFAGPIVIDTATGERVAYAPIRDRNSEYSDNGFLTAQGFLDEDTLLLLVGPINFRTMDIGEEQWHLVAWHFRTGDFELITSGDTLMRGIEVAPDLLGD